MRKHLLLFLTFFGLTLGLTARPVDQETAKAIAAMFMKTHYIQIASTYQTNKGIPAFYVFNARNGFVIVSADDCETPIIGYSHESQFDPNDIPIQMEEYLQDFATRIQFGIENHTVADELTAKQWKLVKSTGRINDKKASKVVTPLITTRWHQGCLYNSLCPEMSGPCGHAEVGCVGVAMGQIMNYWKYPSSGWGSHSYSSNNGTTLSADFGNTIYNWELMPDSLNGNSNDAEIEAVATLLYHCGVSVDMSYSSNGSGAETKDVPDALKRYFNYSKLLYGVKKGNDNTAWLELLKNDLDRQHPVLYSGKGGPSHAFVCDGYDENDMLHFNWGWGGNGDGYYALGTLNPIGYNFSNYNYAIFGIDPNYEPYQVEVTINPPTAGIVIGAGEYHIGEQCTLTAVPAENCAFYCWKTDGMITSYSTSYTVDVEDDINNIEACFSYLPVKQVTAIDTHNPDNPSVNLSWNSDDTHWTLLKQFNINVAQGVVTDDEFIYTYCNTYYPTQTEFVFEKYTMDGELMDSFSFENGFIPQNLTYDGNYFYSRNSSNYFNDKYLCCIDLANQTIIDSVNMNTSIQNCVYDPDNDGFWITHFEMYPVFQSKITLVNRQGQRIKNGPNIPNSIRGAGYINALDGSPHLLMLIEGGQVFDFDITNSSIDDQIPISFDGFALGACIGKYGEKQALFIVVDDVLFVYEIKSLFYQITGFRIYREDDEDHIVMLTENATGSSFMDTTWKEVPIGFYRYGISTVFANGNESEIVWSDPIEKTNYGIAENENPLDHNKVMKVFENGQIIIIKDGKRYNISGQELQ